MTVKVVDFTKPRETNGAGPAKEAWEDPERFDVLDVPAFPVVALPAWMGDWCKATSLASQVPVDLPSVIALSAASLATARLYRVQVRDGWKEPCNLWTATALPPGERKSSVFAGATNPIHRFALESAAELAPRIRERAMKRHLVTGQLDAAKVAAIKSGKSDGGSSMTTAHTLAIELDKLPEIHAPVFVTDDVTPEALAIVLQQNGERIGIFSAEGGPLEIMGGRYCERGTNFEIFLKAHSGDRHIVNRVKREPVHLVEPLLTMALTVQPSVIEGLSTKDGFRGRGLLARFLYSMPQSRVGSREEDPVAMPREVAEQYDRALFNMMKGDPSKPCTLTMSDGADRARAKFQREIEPRLGPDGDLQPIADWANKLTGTVCRIAGVLHVAEQARHPLIFGQSQVLAAVAISEPTFAAAVEIGNYFLAHAIAAFQVMGDDEAHEMAKRIWGWVERKGKLELSERDALRAVRGTVETVVPALSVLVDRCLVRKRPAAPSTGGRPPSPMFDVNPKAVPS